METRQDIRIRNCSPGDERALSLVGQASFLEAFAGVLPVGDILSHCEKQHAPGKYLSWLQDPCSKVWVLELSIGGAPVGYLVRTTPELPLVDLAPTDAEIKRVYLLHRFQGLGLGRLLMEKAREDALASGFRRLLLGVYSRNESALSFYQKLGYTIVGSRRFTVGGNSYDDHILGLAIRS